MINFKDAHHSKDIILYAVFLYICYGISYLDLDKS
jgi:transposase-like protein